MRFANHRMRSLRGLFGSIFRVHDRMNWQETQLSLTNRATRLEVSQGHQTWCHSICLVWFPVYCYSYYVRKNHLSGIRLQICRDLENRVNGPWRSLKMSSFDTEPMTFYWCTLVTMAISRDFESRANQGQWRKLERRYRPLRTAESRAAWRHQFDV